MLLGCAQKERRGNFLLYANPDAVSKRTLGWSGPHLKIFATRNVESGLPIAVDKNKEPVPQHGDWLRCSQPNDQHQCTGARIGPEGGAGKSGP
jgi:hypothetical protein